MEKETSLSEKIVDDSVRGFVNYTKDVREAVRRLKEEINTKYPYKHNTKLDDWKGKLIPIIDEIFGEKLT